MRMHLDQGVRAVNNRGRVSPLLHRHEADPASTDVRNDLDRSKHGSPIRVVGAPKRQAYAVRGWINNSADLWLMRYMTSLGNRCDESCSASRGVTSVGTPRTAEVRGSPARGSVRGGGGLIRSRATGVI